MALSVVSCLSYSQQIQTDGIISIKNLSTGNTQQSLGLGKWLSQYSDLKTGTMAAVFQYMYSYLITCTPLL